MSPNVGRGGGAIKRPASTPLKRTPPPKRGTPTDRFVVAIS